MADGLWAWFHRCKWDAILDQDIDRLHLVDLHNRFWENAETNPAYSLALLEEGIQLAKALDAPCWELFHRYWRVELFLFYTGQMTKALESAVELVLMAQKPAYQGCAVVGDAHRILIDAYVWIDPEGYADRIQQTIDHMEAHMPLDTETRLVLLARRVQLAEALNQKDKAIAFAHRYLADSEHYFFQQTHALQYLCRLLYPDGDPDLLLSYAHQAEQKSLHYQYHLEKAIALAWQALLYRQQGEELRATLCYRRATATIESLQVMPVMDYYDVLCNYHLMADEPEKALALRDDQLLRLRQRGAYYDECRARVAYCKLLAQTGKPLTDALAAARESAHRLKKPDRWLTELDHITGTDDNNTSP